MDKNLTAIHAKTQKIVTPVSKPETIKNKSKQTDSIQWFTLPELEAYLPEKLARQTIYNLVNSGKIPFHKRPGGSKLLFKKAEIDLWISGKPVTLSPKEGARK